MPLPPNKVRNRYNMHVYTRANKIGLTVHSFTYSYFSSCGFSADGWEFHFWVFSSTGPGFSPFRWFIQAFACSAHVIRCTKTELSLQSFREAAYHTKCGRHWLIHIRSHSDNWDWICWSYTVVTAYTLLRCICLLQHFQVRLASWITKWLIRFHGLGVSCCFIHPFNKTNEELIIQAANQCLLLYIYI